MCFRKSCFIYIKQFKKKLAPVWLAVSLAWTKTFASFSIVLGSMTDVRADTLLAIYRALKITRLQKVFENQKFNSGCLLLSVYNETHENVEVV